MWLIHLALKLAMHYMNKHSTAKRPGSIVLVSSTSGYFGGTGVLAYIASKHGVVGLLRASQVEAQKRHIRLNSVAPFFTPTSMTGSYSQQWRDRGLEANTPENVANVIAQTSVDDTLQGKCILVSCPSKSSHGY
jgi:NAD(P)-dependent dehydrogenase (short-subunit alcohol dehydrogenase family)